MKKHVTKAKGEACSEPNLVGEYFSRARQGGDSSYLEAGWHLWENLPSEYEARFSGTLGKKLIRRIRELFEAREFANIHQLLGLTLPDVMAQVPRRRLMKFLDGFMSAYFWEELVKR